MIQFYAPDIERDKSLPESDSGHCCRVLRLKEGDAIHVTDGKGHRFRCIIQEAHPKRTMVEIVGREDIPKQWDGSLTIAVAPTKHMDRMEWMLEKAVEMGVDKVVLLRCQRSERKVTNTERLSKVMVSAMKQSLKGVLPELTGIVGFKEFLKEVSDKDCMKFFGYCGEGFERKEFAKECHPGADTVIMIGPEGDFTPEEVEEATAAGFVPVTFGESRLRTETAALYGVAAFHVIDQLNS